MFDIRGTFLHSERKTGDFIPDEYGDDESKRRSWDYTECRFFTGEAIVKVRLPKDVHDHPFEKGVDYEITVTVPEKTKVTIADAALVAAYKSAA